MKRMIVASMLALALAASSSQKASAWTKFNFSAGVNIGYESTGHNISWGCWNSVSNPAPYGYGCANGACFAPVYQGFPGVPAHAATAPAAPATQTQQVGYYYYGQTYQAPAYWYGY